jgi:hypothetical protein
VFCIRGKHPHYILLILSIQGKMSVVCDVDPDQIFLKMRCRKDRAKIVYGKDLKPLMVTFDAKFVHIDRNYIYFKVADNDMLAVEVIEERLASIVDLDTIYNSSLCFVKVYGLVFRIVLPSDTSLFVKGEPYELDVRFKDISYYENTCIGRVELIAFEKQDVFEDDAPGSELSAEEIGPLAEEIREMCDGIADDISSKIESLQGQLDIIKACDTIEKYSAFLSTYESESSE